VNPALSEGLPAFLAPGAGMNSGFMMPQVTAAALVSENKVLRILHRSIRLRPREQRRLRLDGHDAATS